MTSKGIRFYLLLCLFFVLFNGKAQNSKQYEQYVSTYFQAKKAENNFDYLKYEKLLDQCIKIDKTQSIAFFSKSQLFFVQKNYSQAVKYCLLAIQKEEPFSSVYYEHLFNCYDYNKSYNDALLVAEKLIENDSSNCYYQLLYLETLNSLKKEKQIKDYIQTHQFEFNKLLVDFSLQFYLSNDSENVEAIHQLFLIKESMALDVDAVVANHVNYLFENNRIDFILTLFEYQQSETYQYFVSLVNQKEAVHFDFNYLTSSQHLVLIAILDYTNNNVLDDYKVFWLNNITSVQNNDLLNRLYTFAEKFNFDDLSYAILNYSLKLNPQNIQVIELLSTQLIKNKNYKEALLVVNSGLEYYPYQVSMLLKQLFLVTYVAPKQYSYLNNELQMLTLESNEQLSLKFIDINYQIEVEKKPITVFDDFFNGLNKNDKLFIQYEIEKKWFILQSYL